MKQNTKEQQEINIKENRESKFKLKEQSNFIGSEELLKQMQTYERAYRDGKPLITDEEWDKLVKETNYEESLDDMISPNGRRWVRLNSPLGSLTKINTKEELERFMKSFGKDIPEFIIEPKLDGLSFNAIYKKNNDGEFLLTNITSRGDGRNGLEVFEEALKHVNLKLLPKKISKEQVEKLESLGFINNDIIEIRGEAIINKGEYNLEEPKLVPARSIVAGMFNRKVPMNLTYFLEKYFSEFDNEFSKEQIKAIKKYLLDGKKFTDINLFFYDKDEKKLKYKITQDNFDNFILRENAIGEYISLEHLLTNNDIIRPEENIYFYSFGISDNNHNHRSFLNVKDILNNFYYIGDYIKDVLYKGDKDYEYSTNNINKIISIIDKIYGTKDFIRDEKLVRLKRDGFIPIDGVVLKLKYTNKELQKMDPFIKNGKMIIPKYPKDQVAIKLPSDLSPTVIKEIIYSETKLGNITCSAKVESTVVEGGAIVSSVDLHNVEWLKLPENQWIKPGVECYILMGGDVKPILVQKKNEE